MCTPTFGFRLYRDREQLKEEDQSAPPPPPPQKGGGRSAFKTFLQKNDLLSKYIFSFPFFFVFFTFFWLSKFYFLPFKNLFFPEFFLLE